MKKRAWQAALLTAGLAFTVTPAVPFAALTQDPALAKQASEINLNDAFAQAAKEFGVWIVLLSQLNREADKRTGVPQMADLRDSGDIEGAADVIGLLYREWRRKPTEENKHWAQLHIAKHKNGPTDTINLWFDGETQRFGDWDGPAPRAGVRNTGSD